MQTWTSFEIVVVLQGGGAFLPTYTTTLFEYSTS